jgi:hypothetical protein
VQGGRWRYRFSGAGVAATNKRQPATTEVSGSVGSPVKTKSNRIVVRCPLTMFLFVATGALLVLWPTIRILALASRHG